MNITNCIIIGLISIVLVLFLFYENPFLIKKYKEEFENTNSIGDSNDSINKDNKENTDNSKQDIMNNSLIREYVKTIFSMEKISVGEGANKIIDAIKKNIILTTKKIKDSTVDIIDDIYDIADRKEDLDTIIQATNENIRAFIDNVRLIGKEADDFSQINRNNDFFLRMGNGVAIDIKFNNNYVRNFSDKIESDITIKELLPDNFEGTIEDKDGYKEYYFKDCNIQVERNTDTNNNQTNVTDTITLEINKETNISDIYLDKLNEGISDDTKRCKSIFGTQTIIIKLVLNKNINIDRTTNFKKLIENINISESEFSYQLGFRYLSNTGNEIMAKIYKVRLYLQNVEFKTISMNDWLTKKINDENKSLLIDKLDKIITPMFDLDNEIEKRDKVVKKIHDIYRFNKLSNSQNTLRFYNSHY